MRSLSDAADAGRAALSQLPSFTSGDALASAVLLAMAPARMAVYDRRADAALRALDKPLSLKPGRYRCLMQTVDDLVQARPVTSRSWIPQDLDIALFQLGGRQVRSFGWDATGVVYEPGGIPALLLLSRWRWDRTGSASRFE